jgi:hypothetical protein
MYRSFSTGDRIPLAVPKHPKPVEDPNPLETHRSTSLSDDVDASADNDDHHEIPAAVLRFIFDYVEELGGRSRLRDSAKHSIISRAVMMLTRRGPYDVTEAISEARSFIEQEVPRMMSWDPM